MSAFFGGAAVSPPRHQAALGGAQAACPDLQGLDLLPALPDCLHHQGDGVDEMCLQ